MAIHDIDFDFRWRSVFIMNAFASRSKTGVTFQCRVAVDIYRCCSQHCLPTAFSTVSKSRNDQLYVTLNKLASWHCLHKISVIFSRSDLDLLFMFYWTFPNLHLPSVFSSIFIDKTTFCKETLHRIIYIISAISLLFAELDLLFTLINIAKFSYTHCIYFHFSLCLKDLCDETVYKLT